MIPFSFQERLFSGESLSPVQLFVTLWTAALQASLSINILLPPIPPSIRVFSNQLALRRRWPKYWSFSFSIIPSKEIPGLISFRMNWLDLLAVQGTLNSLFQHQMLQKNSAHCPIILS